MADKKRVLYYMIHPNLKESKVNKGIFDYITSNTTGIESVKTIDLYATYPDFKINVQKEQENLNFHDTIIFQHPLYWYSCPPLLKKFFDDVYTNGYAYGEHGSKLYGKEVMHVVSIGGPKEAYSNKGYNNYTIDELFLPFKQTANLCKMTFLDPMLLHGAFTLNDNDIRAFADEVLKFIQAKI